VKKEQNVNSTIKTIAVIFWILSVLFAFSFAVFIFYFKEFSWREKIFAVASAVLYINVVVFHIRKYL
jgi:hypothetical protein